MFQVKEGDFILSGIDARNGAFGIVPKELEGAIVTNDFWYFEIDENIILKQLFLELTTMSWFDDICRKGSDGTTQRIRLQKNKFFNQKILLPDANKQRDLLDKILTFKKGQMSLNKEIESQKKNITHLKQCILQEAVQGKLTADWRINNPDSEDASVLLKRIQKEKVQLVKDKKIRKERALPAITKDEIPYMIPENWKWCRVGDSGFTQTGNTPPKKNPENFGNFIPFIGPADISNQLMRYPVEGLSELGISVGRFIPRDSLMMVCIGGSIGKCNINEVDVSCNQQINTVTPILIPSIYIKAVCQSPFFQKNIFEKSSGSATPIINKGKWEALPIPLPPLEEQKVIVQKVNALMGLCDRLEQEVKQSQEHSEHLMQSVLREVFEGERKTVEV